MKNKPPPKPKAGGKTPAAPKSGSKPARKPARKPGAEPGLRVAEPVPYYLVAPLEAPVEETLGLLSSMEQAEILEISPKTLARWRRNGGSLTPQQADRVAVLESIFKVGEQTLGSRASVERWLHEKVLSLDCRRPVDFLKTERGRRRVVEVLHGMAWGFAA